MKRGLNKADRRLLERAFAFALECHARGFRKGTRIPYVSHLMQVAGLVFEHGGGVEQAAAGLLHDAVEDSEEVTVELIRERFGERIARIVERCTDTLPGESPSHKRPWRDRKERYLEHMREADEESALVAACDKRHNLGSIVADVRDQGPGYLDRFNSSATQQIWYYEEVLRAIGSRIPARLRVEIEELLAEFRNLVDNV